MAQNRGRHKRKMKGVPHMNAGEGGNSYSNNSSLQKTGISKTKPHFKKAITELYSRFTPQCFTVADMGCSSSPNTLLVISEIVNTVDASRRSLGGPVPEVQVFLNDLPGNDFNTIFKSIPSFYEQLYKDKGENFPRCYITGVPGSFYGRLFPTNTLMFVHSSYGLHWLSRVPEGIESNKGNVYIAKTSPTAVSEAYKKQFKEDFSVFLELRSEEMMSAGRMVITVPGTTSPDPSSSECSQIWEILSESLMDMVEQGDMEEDKVHAFNMPLYIPSDVELTNIIQSMGTFHLDSLEVFDVNWDTSDDPDNKEFVFHKETSARCVTNNVRAISESMIASHFGIDIIDDLFQIYAEKVSEALVVEKIKNVTLVLCMTKKGKVTCL